MSRHLLLRKINDENVKKIIIKKVKIEGKNRTFCSVSLMPPPRLRQTPNVFVETFYAILNILLVSNQMRL